MLPLTDFFRGREPPFGGGFDTAIYSRERQVRAMTVVAGNYGRVTKPFFSSLLKCSGS